MTDQLPLPEVSSVPTCGDCVHCAAGPNTANDIMSRNCYRMPPVPVLAQIKGQMGVISIRPEIRVETPACGEFEPPEDDGPAIGLTS